jgi:hypothetical protein
MNEWMPKLTNEREMTVEEMCMVYSIVMIVEILWK